MTTLPSEQTPAQIEDAPKLVWVLSRERVEAVLEREARTLTEQSARQTLAMLDRGERHGTAAAAVLRTLRYQLRAA